MSEEHQPLLPVPNGGSRTSLWARFKRSAASTFAPLADPERLRPLEKFLLVLALALFLLSSVFIGLFAGLSNRLHNIPPPSPEPSPSPPAPSPPPPEDPWQPHPPPPVEHVCTTPACVLAASDLLRGMNQSVDPCHDFYQFSAGGWLATHAIPDDAGLFGAGQYVAAHNAEVLRKILEDAPVSLPHKPTSDQQALAKLRAYYDSCMDTSTQDAQGDAPLLDLVRNVTSRFEKSSDGHKHKHSLDQLALSEHMDGKPIEHPPNGDPGLLPPAPGGLQSRQARLTRTLAWLHSRGVPALFEWTVDGDSGYNPQLGTPTLAASGLGLPDASYYGDEDDREFYLDVVRDSLHVLGYKHHKALAKSVVKFEQTLAGLSDEAGEVDPIALYNPVNLSTFSAAIKSVEWPGYFSALTTRPPRVVILTDPKWPHKLDDLLSRSSDTVLEAYLVWTTVRTFALNLGPHAHLRVVYDRLDRRLKGVDDDAREDRATTCVAQVNEALGFLAGRYFVQQAFSPEGRTKAEDIIASIIVAFKKRLPSLDWLDPHTRQLAEEKADAVRIKVGYPDKYPNTDDAEALYRFYGDLAVDRTDYFGNALRSTTRLQLRQWLYNDRALNPNRWDMFPAEVNAYYNPTGNEIVFPAGLLQAPYFDASWPDYMNFGAFGQTAGHELSHAFDPQGRLYDKDGYLRDWWTNETAAEFNRRKQCILEQYGNYTVDDGKGHRLGLNARGSIGEDVADGGGLEQAFRAWNASFSADTPASRAANARLPGLGDYTREQLFFTAFGLAWARNIRTTEQVKRLRTDEHSPTMYRVIGSVSNSPAFAQAFGCTPGRDPMARSEEERCAIW